MRKLVLLAGLFLIVLAACKKDEDVYDAGPQLTKDMATIKEYLTKNNLTATLDSASGIYYNIITPGNGVDSVRYQGSKFKALYTGRLLDGTVFDSTGTTPRQFQFNSVILGWQFALQQLYKGGKMNLYLPSFYGYGRQAYAGIPANSVLIFDMEITDIDNNVQ
jgi:FKBP-type peptidyl-prolyl cis-trans isomerase FkpA